MSTVDTTSYYDSLLLSSTTDTSVEITTDVDNTSLTSDDFVTLLLAELEYQDPTEPVDNAQMIDQMTGYSQLEELSEINESLTTLSDTINSMTASNGLDYLGKQVEASGYTVTVSDDSVSSLYFQLDEYAETVTCNVYDSSGSIVDTQTYSQLDAGISQFTWDGTDSSGNTMDDGNYYVLISATNSEGETVDVSTTTTGTVSGVSTTDEGVILTLDDGRSVNMLDVSYATI